MIGSQFNALGPVQPLLLGPNWRGDLPDGFVGAEILQSESDFVGILARVALTDDTEEDIRIVNGIQDSITAMSLSQWSAAGRKDVRAEDVPLIKADFDPDDIPPVTEFWEMPLYDTEGYLCDNPIDRYSLNSYTLERGKLHTEDGKLVIYVQHDGPKDPKQRQSWLPAPKDGFRFYGRYTPLIDGSYNMPGVVPVD